MPLESFLFTDRAGYCQQFSGAMALLLRMGGVPARVAEGFAPGIFDTKKRRYVVHDFDAHSWVEAYVEVNGVRALAVASDIGLDSVAIKARLKEPEIGATINESYSLAQALGINGTPSYVVQNDVVIGAVGYDNLKNKIKSVRDCGSVGC